MRKRTMRKRTMRKNKYKSKYSKRNYRKRSSGSKKRKYSMKRHKKQKGGSPEVEEAMRMLDVAVRAAIFAYGSPDPDKLILQGWLPIIDFYAKRATDAAAADAFAIEYASALETYLTAMQGAAMAGATAMQGAAVAGASTLSSAGGMILSAGPLGVAAAAAAGAAAGAYMTMRQCECNFVHRNSRTLDNFKEMTVDELHRELEVEEPLLQAVEAGLVASAATTKFMDVSDGVIGSGGEAERAAAEESAGEAVSAAKVAIGSLGKLENPDLNIHFVEKDTCKYFYDEWTKENPGSGMPGHGPPKHPADLYGGRCTSMGWTNRNGWENNICYGCSVALKQRIKESNMAIESRDDIVAQAQVSPTKKIFKSISDSLSKLTTALFTKFEHKPGPPLPRQEVTRPHGKRVQFSDKLADTRPPTRPMTDEQRQSGVREADYPVVTSRHLKNSPTPRSR